MTHPTVSVIVPAYNEEEHIEATVKSIQSAFQHAPIALQEIIVSDDASTDGTGSLAQAAGARVVLSGKRNIGATRNVGAAQARGDWLLFVDADTVIEAPTITQLYQAIQNGYIGGGASIRWNGKATVWGELILWVWNTVSRFSRSPAGSFLFTRKDIFETVGGFNETLYATEELDLGIKLSKHGKLIILKHPVKTSPRKLFQFKSREFALLFIKSLFLQKRVLQSRKHLDIWYERRTAPGKVPEKKEG